MLRVCLYYVVYYIFDKKTRGEICPLLPKSYRMYPSPIARKKSAKIAFLGGVTPYFLNRTSVGRDICMPDINFSIIDLKEYFAFYKVSISIFNNYYILSVAIEKTFI